MPDPTFDGLCQKCRHWESCDEPCAPIERLLSDGNRKPYEKKLFDRLIVLYPSRYEQNESESNNRYDDGKPTNAAQALFSTESENSFLTGLEPELLQTNIFIDKFFFGMGYKAIAQKYNVSEKSVDKLYRNAKQRLLKTINAMDRIEFAKENGTPIVQTTKRVRAFLLHALFGLPVVEIGRLLNTDDRNVSRDIHAVRDSILTGEVGLIECSKDGLEMAEARKMAKMEKDSRYKLAWYQSKKGVRKENCAASNV